jgi:hypothetical protein
MFEAAKCNAELNTDESARLGTKILQETGSSSTQTHGAPSSTNPDNQFDII